jgi:hypothetical protein
MCVCVVVCGLGVSQPLLEYLIPGKDLMEEFAALDAQPDREVYPIAVLHRRAGQHTLEEMCRNPTMTEATAPPGFFAFLRGLGTPQRSDQPELEFHVPTLMPVPPERYASAQAVLCCCAPA